MIPVFEWSQIYSTQRGRDRSVAKKVIPIDQPKGKLGVLIPGMGAVATTFIAGVEAVRRRLALPVGSLTQMGTLRLGKRTDRRAPSIKTFVPLAELDDLVFGGWDLFKDNCYEAAGEAGGLDRSLLEQGKNYLAAIPPLPAIFEQRFVKKLPGGKVKKGKTKNEPGEQGHGNNPEVKKKNPGA